MPDRDPYTNALADSYTTADVLGSMRQPTLADVVKNFLSAPRMQQIPRLERGGPVPSPMGPIGDALKSWSNTPGAITNALGYIPEDVGLAMSLLPGGRLPSRASQLASNPWADAGVALSRNRATAPDFGYVIFKDGKPVGQVRGTVNGDTAHFLKFEAFDAGGPNALGVGGLRQMREAFRPDFPQVTRFSGERESGARGASSPVQSVVMRKPPADDR